jgi:hypothetical protein
MPVTRSRSINVGLGLISMRRKLHNNWLKFDNIGKYILAIIVNTVDYLIMHTLLMHKSNNALTSPGNQLGRQGKMKYNA